MLTACAPEAKNDKTAAASAPAPVSTEKPCTAGGRVELQLPGGEYDIRPAVEDRVRVTLTGNQGDTKVDIATAEKGASVKLSDTPHNGFRATIDVPRESDLVVRLSGGDLTIGPVTGSKDIEAYAGNVTIAIPDPAEYGSAEASVKAGDLDARPFGQSKSGLMSSFKWSGSGKHTLRASLGAGNLKLEGR